MTFRASGIVLLGSTFIAITALGLQIGRLLAPEAPRRVLALMTASFGVGQIAEWTGNFVAASIGAAIALLLAGAVAWSAGPSPNRHDCRFYRRRAWVSGVPSP